MNKAELVAAIAEKTGTLKKKDAEMAVKMCIRDRSCKEACAKFSCLYLGVVYPVILVGQYGNGADGVAVGKDLSLIHIYR